MSICSTKIPFPYTYSRCIQRYKKPSTKIYMLAIGENSNVRVMNSQIHPQNARVYVWI